GAGTEPVGDSPVPHRPARLQRRRGTGPVELPHLRHKVYGVPRGRPARLPGRLRALPRGALTDPRTHSPRDPPRRQGAAPPPPAAGRVGRGPGAAPAAPPCGRDRTLRTGRGTPRLDPPEGSLG